MTWSPGRETPGAPPQERAELAGAPLVLGGLRVCSPPAPSSTSTASTGESWGQAAAIPCRPTLPPNLILHFALTQPGQPRASRGLPDPLPQEHAHTNNMRLLVNCSPQNTCGVVGGRLPPLSLPSLSFSRGNSPLLSLAPSHRLDVWPTQLGEGGAGVPAWNPPGPLPQIRRRSDQIKPSQSQVWPQGPSPTEQQQATAGPPRGSLPPPRASLPGWCCGPKCPQRGRERETLPPTCSQTAWPRH